MNLFSKKKKTNHTVLKVIGGAALAAVAAGLIVNLHDIRRYIKIISM